MEFNETKTKKEFNMEEIPCLSKSKSAISILKSKTSVENTSIDEENNSSSDESADNINNKYKRMKSFDEKFEKEIAKNYDLENKLKHSITNAENINKKDFELATEINYKSIPDKIYETDEFGFIQSEENQKGTPKKPENNNDKKKYLLLINSRTEKWLYMLNNYETFYKKKYNKLKKRTRKGIPDNLRSNVWQLFADIKSIYKKGLFQELCNQKSDQDAEEVILKDLDRTFPSCQLFAEKYGGGQRKLFSVLSCFSKYQKEIGYVQGMSFFTALFLTYMDEESTFFMLNSLMEKYNMKRVFSPGFPDLNKLFYVLLNLEKKFVPNVYYIFQRDLIAPSLYATEWFICLFSKYLNFNFVVRIFDTFLLEGFKVIYRFALGILKIKEKYFLESKNMPMTLNVLRKHIENQDLDNLFNLAFGFHLSRDTITKLENEYEKVKENSKDEFISQL